MEKISVREQIVLITSCLLESLDEAPGGWAPSSHLWLPLMGFGVDVSFFNQILELLVASDLITHKNHVVTITEKGRKLAEESRNIKKGCKRE